MLSLVISCANKQSVKNTSKKTANNSNGTSNLPTEKPIIVGAANISAYIPILKGKKIAVVANQTSMLHVLQRTSGGRSTMGSKVVAHHLVDYLHNNYGIKIQKVFSPEHGFRGKANAGEIVADDIDLKTGLPIISLYGKNKKPTKEQLNNVEIVVFDIQDVGARFYTYISTLHYVMEACAEQNIKVIVLDRPNPNGNYIDGPVLKTEHKSFVGMHPVPVVYGMTIGEYAQMINGENWLNANVKCDLTVIKLKNYTHNSNYSLPIKPSPNLPNDKAINLYPSLCFFEGTNVSAGRGTAKQFQIFGSPFLNSNTYNFTFTPQPNNGAKYPKHQNKKCYGMDLSSTSNIAKIDLTYLINAYNNTKDKNVFFNIFFTKLAGTTKLQQQIIDGLSEQEIKQSWQQGINEFKTIRQKYLIYK